ncbi:MAG: peptide-methionine (S)-S-oxide reductase [Alphaproteobacteria bacterium]|nr:peptide-methionine (S)-S-oxide reductase [Alphaproteobacteria bacterium]
MDRKPEDNFRIATLGGGCFWCLESELRARDGILYTVVGYSGGHLENPTYEDVTTGTSGHAEVVQVFFDPEQISYTDILHFFLTDAHDPTQLNRQGVDVGPQYRSVIFYHDAEQKRAAESIIARLNGEMFRGAIVTEVTPFETFWPAEEYHQQYYEKYEQQFGKPHIRILLKKQVSQESMAEGR